MCQKSWLLFRNVGILSAAYMKSHPERLNRRSEFHAFGGCSTCSWARKLIFWYVLGSWFSFTPKKYRLDLTTSDLFSMLLTTGVSSDFALLRKKFECWTTKLSFSMISKAFSVISSFSWSYEFIFSICSSFESFACYQNSYFVRYYHKFIPDENFQYSVFWQSKFLIWQFF